MSEVFDVRGIISALETHALSLGKFESVNLHEPKSAPGNGVTCAIWLSDYAASPLSSGMATTRQPMVGQDLSAAFASTPDVIDRCHGSRARFLRGARPETSPSAVSFSLSTSWDIMRNVFALARISEHHGKIFRVMTILVR